MAQRESGYQRQDNDSYWTPDWVYQALHSVEPDLAGAIDVAPRNAGIVGYDFLSHEGSFLGNIATNPPFQLSDKFVKHALALSKTPRGKVAMLLPVTWDTAHTRRPLFEFPFKAKYILTKRIRWENLEQKKNGPSTNHAWYVWDWAAPDYFARKPFLGWLP